MKKLRTIAGLLLLLSSALPAQTWTPLGPYNRTGPSSLPAGQGSGRIYSITYHPKYGKLDPSIGNVINKTVFAGSPYGGIWISRNDGASWSNSDPLLQYTNLSTDMFRGCGVTDIVIDSINPTTMYASFCSSEYAPGFPLNSIGMRNYNPSTGIYKYTPASGWTPYLIQYPYQSNHSIAALTMHPANPAIIFAATSDGIIKLDPSLPSPYYTTVLTNGLNKPFRNVVFDPTNSSTVFASGQEVYKSTNGGTSFTAISNFATLIPGISGIMQINIGVISATSIYARVHYNIGEGRYEVFYRYDGTTWTSIPIFPIKMREYHYDRMPMLAKKVGTTEYVFAGSEILNLYNSSTSSWSESSNYNSNMHADIHDITFSPDGSTLMVGHDGGVSTATLNFYSAPNWVTRNTGLNIATIISFSGAQKDPNIILSGEYDNGNTIIRSATTTPVSTGYDVSDGGDKLISWDDPNVWYDRQQMYGSSDIYRNTDGNEANTYQFSNLILTNSSITPAPNFSSYDDPHFMYQDFEAMKPMVMDPNNKNVIYRGSNILTRSMDGGLTSQVIFRKSDCFDQTHTDIYSLITGISIAPSNSNYLYINTTNQYPFDPNNQLDVHFTNHIYKNTNALNPNYTATCTHPSSGTGVLCTYWTDITPPFPPVAENILKKSFITAIVVSDKDPNLIWAAFNYNPDLPNFRLWKYDGTTWTDYSTGLPANTAITALVYEKGSNDGIYAGTDVAGIFYRNKALGSWVAFGTGMPHAKVMQMEINNKENTIRAGTFGRGIWKSSLYCPTVAYTAPDPCNECNSTNNYFWEGTNVTIRNTTLTARKHFVRAVDYIDILPATTLTASATASYDLYIHGCGPTQKNSYRKYEDNDISDEELVINDEEDEEGEAEMDKTVTLFPNPNNGTFTINMETTEVKDIFIYNVLGDVIYQKNKTSEKTLNIDISKEPKGVYLVQILDEKESKTIKIINE